MLARHLHGLGPRSRRPFIPLNCVALPRDLIESELFGHEKGSFTHAERRHLGAFEQASGGTLFLDEIGDASPAVQARLLRVLNDKTVRRIGGEATSRSTCGSLRRRIATWSAKSPQVGFGGTCTTG
ncbi:MAG: sigma 54-interacting transcriptional regulator [Candidatus Krumholzibacteriia bacterium]